MDNFVIYNLEERNGQLDSINNDVISQWIKYEKEGKKIIICTNKNLSYTMGMLQTIPQINPTIIAESGAVIYEKKAHGSEKLHVMNIENGIKEKLIELKKKLELEFQDIWFQDNNVGIMMYYNKPEMLRVFLKKESLDNFRIDYKDNSICIMPEEISYDKAIVWISKNEN